MESIHAFGPLMNAACIAFFRRFVASVAIQNLDVHYQEDWFQTVTAPNHPVNVVQFFLLKPLGSLGSACMQPGCIHQWAQDLQSEAS